MKRAIAGVLGVLGLAVAGFAGVVAMQPSEMHVERSVTADATPQDVAAWMVDLKKVNAWSPWEKLDPEMTKTYSDVTDQVGSSYAWDGNDDVGAGEQTIASIESGTVTHDLHFMRPFESEARITFTWAEAEAGKTTVTWAMDSHNGFMSKAAGLFIDMDVMIGSSFEDGLGMLEPLAETTRTEREAAEAAALLAAAAVEEEAAEDGVPTP